MRRIIFQILLQSIYNLGFRIAADKQAFINLFLVVYMSSLQCVYERIKNSFLIILKFIDFNLYYFASFPSQIMSDDEFYLFVEGSDFYLHLCFFFFLINFSVLRVAYLVLCL
ncbi:hypothetical protein EGW08_018560 [Elysia chlorotica]|uniref:Uncharacterized protein n=1 Tax=Elysia chlorotica TaxID=188477 RepID=A0A433SWQ0_ELYCH|nr:hypothetical protein EGW08_018560 [Elysia chlorotica]